MGWTTNLAVVGGAVPTQSQNTVAESGSTPFVLNFNATMWEPDPYFDPTFRPFEKPQWLSESEAEETAKSTCLDHFPVAEAVDPVQLAEQTLIEITKNRFLLESSRVRAASLILERYDMKNQIARLVDRVVQLEAAQTSSAKQ